MKRGVLRVWQRGLVIIVIPVIIGFAVVGTGWITWAGLEHKIRSGSINTQMAVAVAKLSVTLVESGIGLIKSGLDAVSRLLVPSDKTIHSIKEIAAHPEISEQKRDAAHDLESHFRSVRQMILEYAKVRSDPNRVMGSFDVRGFNLQMIESWANYWSAASKLAPDDLKDLESVSHEGESLRAYLAAGFVLNVLVALSLMRPFTKSIAGRIETLAGNADRYAAGLPFQRASGPDDEIGTLENAFAGMVSTLNAAHEEQVAYSNVLRDQLAEPLLTLGRALDDLSQGFYGDLNERGKQAVQSASRSRKRLSALVDDLLTLNELRTRELSLVLSVVPVSNLVREAIESVSDFAAEHAITISTEISDSAIEVDGRRIVQVLINLLSNAIKFSPAGSSVELSESALEHELVISVRDHGKGMPKAVQNSLFKQFQSIEKSEKMQGSGVGLSICRAIIESHGGNIDVTSEEGKGTTVSVRLKRHIATDRAMR